jgi:MFS family permease
MKDSHLVLKQGWSMLLVLLFAVIPTTFTSTLLAPGLPSLAAQLGTGAEGVQRAQILMTIPGIGMICAPILGWMADRVGTRRVFLASLSIDTLAGLGCLFTDEFVVLLILRFMLGIGVGGVIAVSLSMIGDFYSGEARTKLLGYRQAATSVFVLVATQIAGYLTDSYGWSSPLYAYLVGIPLIIFAMLRVPPDQRKIVSRESLTVEKVSWLRDPSTVTLALAMVGNIFLAIVTYNVYTQLPFLMTEKGYSASAYANVMMPKLACSFAFSFVFIYLHKFLHPLAIISFSLLLCSISIFGFSISTESYQLLIAAIIGGPSTVMLEPALCSFLLARMPPSRRAMTMGGIMAAFHLGPFLIPFVFGRINSDYGFAASFQLLSAAAGLAGLVLIIGMRARVLQKHYVEVTA